MWSVMAKNIRMEHCLLGWGRQIKIRTAFEREPRNRQVRKGLVLKTAKSLALIIRAMGSRGVGPIEGRVRIMTMSLVL